MLLLLCSLQCGNMAREGLRTLVVAQKTLTAEVYQDFEVYFIVLKEDYLHMLS